MIVNGKCLFTWGCEIGRNPCRNQFELEPIQPIQEIPWGGGIPGGRAGWVGWASWTGCRPEPAGLPLCLVMPPCVDMPTSNIEVLQYAAKLMNISLPKIEEFDVAKKKMSPMALSFWKENRRVSNNLLCKKMGYSLIHPNYKSGLKDCLKSLWITFPECK